MNLSRARAGQRREISCLGLIRADPDPAWPLILAQLAGRQPIPLRCDGVLAAAVTAQDAFHGLAFVGWAQVPDLVSNGTVGLVLPAWPNPRQAWPPDQRFSCGRHGLR
jgi:hypothetical protein